MKKNRVGKETTTFDGQKMKIIRYGSSTDIDVQFEDGTIVENKSYISFKKGLSENPNVYATKESRLNSD